MLNYFNENILPLSEELDALLEARELREEKDIADAQTEADAVKSSGELDCYE